MIHVPVVGVAAVVVVVVVVVGVVVVVVVVVVLVAVMVVVVAVVAGLQQVYRQVPFPSEICILHHFKSFYLLKLRHWLVRLYWHILVEGLLAFEDTLSF